jgi:hypothetical protein
MKEVLTDLWYGNVKGRRALLDVEVDGRLVKSCVSEMTSVFNLLRTVRWYALVHAAMSLQFPSACHFLAG